MIPSVVVGKFTGTGAAVNVLLGFKPDFVMIINVTDGDIIGAAIRGAHAAGASTDIGAAAASNADNALTLTYEGADGEGFTAGTDFSEADKVYGYLALRTGPGGS